MPHKDPEVARTYFRERARKIRQNDPEKAKAYYNKNKEQILERMRSNHLESTYGISNEEYLEKLLAQDSRCAICFKHETSKTKTGKIKPLSVDHCHTTGRIRKLLCSKCNSMIGMANESKEILYAAIKYLEAYE